MRLRRAALCVLTCAALAATGGVATAAPASAGSTLEARLAQKVNAARADHGLGPLQLRAGLSDYARSHSGRMAGSRALFHTADFGVICCWSSISENVGLGSSVRSVHRMLMRSPGHRANILDPRKRAVGVGIVRSGDRLWVTQVFRQPR